MPQPLRLDHPTRSRSATRPVILSRRRRARAYARPKGGSGRPILMGCGLLLVLGAAVGLGLLVLAAVALGSAYNHYTAGLPDPAAVFSNLQFNQETVVTDRTGKTVLARWAKESRDVVTFAQISPEVLDATTAAEDKTFWDNAGFDPFGMASAVIDTLNGHERGASTITQQLVRNRLLPTEAFTSGTIDRKIREVIQSARLTNDFPGVAGKQLIITAYLNDNYYGNQSYGIAAAARGYFGITDLSKLTLAQAATLAAILQAPSAYDLMTNAETDTVNGKPLLIVPLTSEVALRRNWILDRMRTESPLSGAAHSAADYDAAMLEPIVLHPPAVASSLAYAFTQQVRNQLSTILCGTEAAGSCPALDTGGYQVTTTLSVPMQKLAEKWTEAAARVPNAPDPAAYAKQLGVPYQSWMANLMGAQVENAALDAIDYRTGQVWAYTGSAGVGLPASKKLQPLFDVMANGWRQPGSTFKAVGYSVGLDDGDITASTLLMDVATDFGGGYIPTDADLAERGPLRVREAIQGSFNIPAIKAGVRIGPDRIFARAQDFGIHWPFSTNKAGASIAIGTLEVHMADLTSAYGTIANGGVLMPRTTILTVHDTSGALIWSSSDTVGTRAESPEAAYVMTSILASNTDPAQNPFWALRGVSDKGIRRPAALKTGTNDNSNDLVALGFVAPPADPALPALVVGTWMGNSDNSAPTKAIVALESAASFEQQFMTRATAGTPIVDFVPPSDMKPITIDPRTGLLPGPYTRQTISEWYVPGTEPGPDTIQVALPVEAESGLLWQDGCSGTKVTHGFYDLSKVEAAYPSWQKDDNNWIARASRGLGVRGGRKGSPTEVFFEAASGWTPFGLNWGLPFPPTASCVPNATPSIEPSLPPCPDPLASPDPLAPPPDPLASPALCASPAPSLEPSPSLEPGVSPSPSPDSLPSPSPSPSPSPGPSPGPSPSPSLQP